MIGKQICTHFDKLNVTNLFAFKTAFLKNKNPARLVSNEARQGKPSLETKTVFRHNRYQ